MMRYLVVILYLFLSVQLVTANDYYTATGAPADGSAGTSAVMRAEFERIETGMDLLPTMTGNPDLPVFINSSGTAQETISASSALTKLSAAPLASPAFTGVPTAPTAATGTSTTQIATTAFVQSEASAINPNRLINPNFVVNQEDYDDGVAELDGGEYGHDMWESVGSANSHVIYTVETKGDITIDSLENTSAVAAKDVGIQQNNDGFELDATNEEEITISIYVVSFITAMSLYHDALGLQELELGWNSFTFTSNTSGTVQLKSEVAISTTVTPAFRFNSFKVEHSGVRTKYQEPEPVAEANRCYRYFLKFGSTNKIGVVSSTTTTVFNVVTPVKMDTGVVASYTSGLIFEADGTSTSVSSLSTTAVNPGVVLIEATTATISSAAGAVVAYVGNVELDARY